MRVTFPHIGYTWVPVRAIGNKLGVDMIVPPLTSKRTLSLGVKYAPETLCLPFKLSLGNMIEGLEMGGDTIIMLGQYGPCRFGYYNKLQESILHELGYKFKMLKESLGIFHIIKFVSGASTRAILSALHFGMVKLKALDDIERLVYKVRAVDLNETTATHIYKDAIKAIDAAGDYRAIRQSKKEHVRKLESIPTVSSRTPLKIGFTGEFFVVIDSFANMDIDIELGKMGVEVARPHSVWAWLGINPLARAFGLREKDKSHQAAMPYLSRHVGGDGWQSVGERVLHAEEWDGIIHIEPFGCLPEIMARNIALSMKDEVPVLNIIYDEHTGRAGIISRLEAFVDLLERKRRTKNKNLEQSAAR